MPVVISKKKKKKHSSLGDVTPGRRSFPNVSKYCRAFIFRAKHPEKKLSGRHAVLSQTT